MIITTPAPTITKPIEQKPPELFRTFLPRVPEVSALSWSSDGQFFVVTPVPSQTADSRSRDSQRVHVFDSKQESQTSIDDFDGCGRLFFHPHDLVFCSFMSGQLSITDITSKKTKTVAPLPLGPTSILCWTPEGERIVVCTQESSTLYLQSISRRSGSIPARTEISSIATSAFFSRPDELIVGFVDGSISQYSYPALEKLYTFQGHTGTVSAFVFAPTGNDSPPPFFISSGSDGCICVWEYGSFTVVRVIAKSSAAISSMSLSHNGEFIAYTSADNQTLEIAQTFTGASVYSQQTESVVNAVSWNPKSLKLIYGGKPVHSSKANVHLVVFNEERRLNLDG
ncbi:hypothetical protein BLNAU_15481 [Blattamonas nauphoetae]|uniref:Uncharacterized protein n=1 Tax=Blattamonas nauphoetae TaxID=2049346 RepID=A0ABQ9XCG4_9EUKA|nr:hypothetical protein BLNAU_15481 [Blattamonas nauphoetae]